MFVAVGFPGTTCNSGQLAGAPNNLLLISFLCDLCGEKRSFVSKKLSSRQGNPKR